MAKKYLYLDIESHNAGREYSMEPRDFFRLGQYAWNDGEVVITTDYDEMIAVIREADYVIGHNISSFDLRVLFGVDSLEPLEMALAGKVLDTFVLASLLTPAPYSYTNSKGHTFYDAASPEQAKKWLALDNLCFQFNLPGKFGDLAEIAKRYNPPKTLRRNLDLGLIPLDDPEFREYADQDVIAVRGLYPYLVNQIKEQDYNRDYIWREMIVWSLNAQITKNGVRVDITEAQDRVAHLQAERDEVMDWLVETFDFPTEGKQPWKSAKGKEAIVKALKSFGIHTTDPNWTRTASGAPSFSGDTMKAITEGTEAEKLGAGLATLQGQRSLAALALESVKEDGKAHPDIMCLQRSGRTSVQRPGLTIWTARGPGAVEKRYFIPDEGHKMVSMDFSSADARAMAALSGDAAYAVQFQLDENGKSLYDSHNLVGEAAFGTERYYTGWDGPRDADARPALRDPSKVLSHSVNYNVGAKKLATGMNEACEREGLDIRFSPADARDMIDGFHSKNRLLKRFKDKAVQEGESFGYVENPWGRRMKVDDGRAYNQGPALHGQSVTRERIYDGLIKIAKDKLECIRWVKFPVHDEVVLSIPVDSLDWGVPYFQENMSGVFDPLETSGDDPKWTVSQPIEFLMSAGEPADNWWRAGH